MPADDKEVMMTFDDVMTFDEIIERTITSPKTKVTPTNYSNWTFSAAGEH